MLATIQINQWLCTFDGKKWDSESPMWKRHLNAYTETLEIGPADGDPLLAVVYKVMDVFPAQIVTLPPPAPGRGDGVVY